MIIQLNKLGREFTDLSALRRSLEDRYSSSFKYRTCILKEIKTDEPKVGYFCKHCGLELQGIWKENYFRLENPGIGCIGCPKQNAECKELREILDDESKKMYSHFHTFDDEIETLARLTHCPVCGAELIHKPGFYFADVYSLWKEKLLDDACHSYSRYKRRFQLVDEQEIRQKAAAFATACDLPSAAPISFGDAEKIRNSPAELKKYIHSLISLEMGIYSLTNRLQVLYRQSVLTNRDVVAAQHLPAFEQKQALEQSYQDCHEAKKKLRQYQTGEAGPTPPAKPEPPVLAVPSLFNKKKVAAENAARQEAYDAELRQYHSQVRQYEAEKARLIRTTEEKVAQAQHMIRQKTEELEQSSQDKMVNKSAITAKKVVDNEVSAAETMLRKLYTCRNQLYSYDIVFGKYRDAVALSTFYEYLMAGRCTTLEGTDGAYNLYEAEIRANTIIGQLSQVIEKLDKIQQSQYMIYSQLTSINDGLTHLNKTMDSALTSIQHMDKSLQRIADNSDVVAYSSAVTAYYSKVNAELTNALGFMAALN